MKILSKGFWNVYFPNLWRTFFVVSLTVLKKHDSQFFAVMWFKQTWANKLKPLKLHNLLCWSCSFRLQVVRGYLFVSFTFSFGHCMHTSVNHIHRWDILCFMHFTCQVVGGRERPFILGMLPQFLHPPNNLRFTHPKNWGGEITNAWSRASHRAGLHAMHFWRQPKTVDQKIDPIWNVLRFPHVCQSRQKDREPFNPLQWCFLMCWQLFILSLRGFVFA